MATRTIRVPLKSKFSLYFHIPFCRKKCGYCDFFSLENTSLPDLNLLLQKYLNHIDYWQQKLPDYQYETIYFGGGTPSVLPSWFYGKLLERIHHHWKPMGNISRDRRITIEVNPEDLSKILLTTYEELGIGRLSMGIQSFQKEMLLYLDRQASEASVLRSLEVLGTHWKGQWNADLISGIPTQDSRGLERDLGMLLSYEPDHISFYQLTREPGTPLAEKWDGTNSLGEVLWIQGKNLLEKAGYRWYEISNFSQPGKESLHNLVYWHYGNFLGIGPSASGTMTDVLNDPRPQRYRIDYPANLANFLNQEPAEFFQKTYISPEEAIQEEILMGLRLKDGLPDSILKRIPSESLEHWHDYLSQGKLIRDNGRLFLESEQRLLLDQHLERLIP